MKERPEILFQNKPKDGEGWVMECTIIAHNGDKHVELKCFATEFVVKEFLRMLWEVVHE